MTGRRNDMDFLHFTKGEPSHNTTQNPNERIPSLTRLSCLCWLRLPRKTLTLPPSSHPVRMISLFSRITASVTQPALTPRQKLIQKESPVNCVQRQFEALFLFRKTNISCPNFSIFFCNSDTDVLNCPTSLNTQILNN